MGIFNNIKNFITGGAANVSISVVNPVVDDTEQLKIILTITAEGEDISFSEIYIQIKALEESASLNTLYEDQITIAESVFLRAAKTKTWEFSVSIKEHARPTYRGKHSSLEWYVLGGIEMPGVNPESKAIQFVLNKAMTFN